MPIGRLVADPRYILPKARRPKRFGTSDPVGRALELGASGPVDDPTLRDMALNRRVNARQARAMQRQASTGSGGSLNFATGKPNDPMFYWQQNNLPYRVWEPEELKKLRAYCNTPEAPVWMGDYSFKPIGEIVEGDEVIGWIYNTGPGGQKRKKLVRTKVVAVQRRIAPMVVRVTMESGRVIRCTPDHQWANPLYSPGAKVQRPGDKWTAEYLPAGVGRELVSIIEPTEELSDEKLRLAAAWLGGLYDGEATAERLAQCVFHNPEVRERIKSHLDLLGIAWTEDDRAIYIRTSGGNNGSPSRQQFVDFLNWSDPVRRTTTAIDKRLLGQPKGGRDRVVSIEEEGAGEVVSMQTETGNYTAWGYASKNCRLIYLTHPILASAIDIYSQFPLTGMELTCKDPALVDFYGVQFFDRLKYDTVFLKKFGREYWTVGEACALGSFNDVLGIWEEDELLDPDSVDVRQSPFFRDPFYYIKLPEHLRKLIQDRSPKWEYEALVREYPELLQFAGDEARMPVSNVLLRHSKFEADPFNPRGIPIMLRAIRSIVQEEKLNAAQDAVADRLYTPLVLAKLGASATDLGTNSPWVPTEPEMEEFETLLDAALAADFRVLTYNFAVEMDTVFGREVVPDFNSDFDRLIDRQLQPFGLSRTMLMGAGQGETYAADALNRDLVTQLLTGYQNGVIRAHYRERALVVAEAQGHFDYEERGGKKYPIMEEAVEIDPATGDYIIVEQPKLLIPDLQIKAMNMHDEEESRKLMEALRESGVPISMKRRLTNIDVDLDAEIDLVADEAVKLAVAKAQTDLDTYKALRNEGLPIPVELRAMFEPKAGVPGGGNQQAGEDPLTPLHGEAQPDYQQIGHTSEEVEQVRAEEGDTTSGGPQEGFRPRNWMQTRVQRSRPEESDEQRAGMPTAASHRTASVRDSIVAHGARRLIQLGSISTGPAHIGLRRWAGIRGGRPLDEQMREDAPVDGPSSGLKG